MSSQNADEDEIRSRWENIPVGENIVGSLSRDFNGDYEAFFRAYDKWLYGTQSHILRGLDQFSWKGKRVLEIGLGQGSDSEQLIRRGAVWSGLDLTRESVERVKRRLTMRNLAYEHLVQGSAVNLPFRDGEFDIVYSHGVLHHIPEIDRAQREIRRVLINQGRLILMVYSRNSLNYHVAIKFVRRIGLGLLYILPLKGTGIYAEHKKLARQTGLFEYLKLDNFIHRSTDGPTNPFSKLYDYRSLQKDFSEFKIIKTFKLWMHAPPLPVHGLPGERILGWHLWAELAPKLPT